MNKIGLIGAPGSGKADLGAALRQSDKWRVLRTPGYYVEHKYNQAMGQHASYREELWGFFELLSYERTQTHHDFLVSPGTLLHPLAHAMVGMKTIERGINTPELSMEYEQRQQAFATMTMLFLELTRYKYLYYLPFPLLPEGERPDDYQYNLQVDQSIEFILEQFGLWKRIKKLTGTTQERADYILADIKSYETKLAAEEEANASVPDGD